jgi:choline monooxygenase
LALSIDESNYTAQLLSPGLSVQHAPPAKGTSSSRFGIDRAGVYAFWYPNIMFNRYGPWLDVDIVKPVDATTSIVHKAWFLERDYMPSNPTSREDFIAESLQSSEKIHDDEDVFMCENVQRGLTSGGFHRGRYVQSKQIGA